MKDKHIRAVIFDMDGLMLDSERISREAWKEAGTEWGYDISYEAYAHVLGRTVPDAVTIFKGIFGNVLVFLRQHLESSLSAASTDCYSGETCIKG